MGTPGHKPPEAGDIMAKRHLTAAAPLLLAASSTIAIAADTEPVGLPDYACDFPMQGYAITVAGERFGRPSWCSGFATVPRG